MELFKIKEIKFCKEDFLDDISEFEDIIPLIQDLQENLTYKEEECAGINDCCNKTNKNYIVEIRGIVDENDEFIPEEELLASGRTIEENLLDIFIITLHKCVNCGKWVIGIFEADILE